MSGSREPHGSIEDQREVEHLLAQPAVKAYLARPFQTDYSHEIPLTGGSSRDGKTYYVDEELVPKYRRFVLWHERVEKALRAVLGFTYDRAHRYATAAERIMVEKAGVSWAAYSHVLSREIQKDHAEGPQKMPPGFDPGPYEGKDRRLFK